MPYVSIVPLSGCCRWPNGISSAEGVVLDVVPQSYRPSVIFHNQGQDHPHEHAGYSTLQWPYIYSKSMCGNAIVLCGLMLNITVLLQYLPKALSFCLSLCSCLSLVVHWMMAMVSGLSQPIDTMKSFFCQASSSRCHATENRRRKNTTWATPSTDLQYLVRDLEMK